MSHFPVAVLVPGDLDDPKAIIQAVENAVAAYDENTRVEPYPVYLEDHDIECITKYHGQLTAETITDYAGGVGAGQDDNGWYYLSTYNPKSKWDWWEVGGRWSNRLPGDTALVRELPDGYETFAIVTPDGQWFEKGKMGWWACVSNEKDAERWRAEFTEILSAFPDARVVQLDCHI